MTVISEERTSYRLHVDSAEEGPLERDQDLYGDFIIVRENPNNIDIQQLVETFGNGEQQLAPLIQTAKSYLAGEVSFAHYLENASDYLDTSELGWTFERYSMLGDNLLPFLLTDRDIERRNRLITIFCPVGKLSKSVLFSKACAELFLEHLMSNDDLNLSDRWNDEVEISDLSEEFLDKYQKFGQTLLMDVDRIRKGAL